MPDYPISTTGLAAGGAGNKTGKRKTCWNAHAYKRRLLGKLLEVRRDDSTRMQHFLDGALRITGFQIHAANGVHKQNNF